MIGALLDVARPKRKLPGRGGGPSRVVPSSPVGCSDGRGYGSVTVLVLLKWDSVCMWCYIAA